MKWLLAAAVLAVAPALAAQQPAAVPDSARVVEIPDSLLGATPAPPADSLRVHRLPALQGRPRAGADTEVWTFDREDLLAMRGLSLADLLADVPGVTRLRGGDYGAPEVVTAYGLAGGQIRVFWDGFEQIPLEGAVTDLSHIGLGGVESVRVERHPGQLRVELASLRDQDPRVLSLVEAGTGDYDTNFFRGTFVHPRALGGSFGLALDRVDTNGPNDEAGSRTGGWLRYHRFFDEDRIALTAEARRMKAGADIADYPGESTRLDWVVRGRWQPTDGIGLQAFTGRSGLDGSKRDGRLPVDRDRRQHGLIADLARGPVRAEAGLRWFGGPAVPSRSLDLSATAELPLLGGATVGLSSEAWEGDAATLTRIAAWSRPLFGLSLFASRDSGERGVALYPLPSEEPDPPAQGEEPDDPEPEPDPEHDRVERTALRLGLRFTWRGADVAVSRTTLETDSLPRLFLPMDRDGLDLPGFERSGMELSGSVPLPLLPDGFALSGSLTQWEEGARYLPRRSYQGYLVFHNQYKESGNLELWGRIGVEGRSPMRVPLADPAVPVATGADPVPLEVPSYQSWQALIQVRVVALRLFVAWENFTVRRTNQDFPGRVLPIFRAHYGVRWFLWN